MRLVGGVLALWAAWLAVAQARAMGINFLLSVLVLVWVADIFAYFAGRTFGLKFTKNKLAPAISPGKSWEGVWGGMLGVLVLALVWAAGPPLRRGRAQFLQPCWSRGLAGCWWWRPVHGGDERGGRPGRIADQAQRGCQGQQRPAARPWRRAGPHRRAAAHCRWP
jgi:hypothetical protein